ncbi:hypothetical protein [Vitiosangium sp. GDMCC 1.1324]|uniref:hypothetical protein n=1 Tax=Vitiosangium sp. (strain GDMCC 1.1324) TaxID=2138576 RepID=UPI000D331752|nr:hypothetical protein [Vitiosangium sp. GDMCC 1.1324]PTL83962.1 hypothetical protein DAT35_10915 [Vitiosangium sp. GDMCC 1.1324]
MNWQLPASVRPEFFLLGLLSSLPLLLMLVCVAAGSLVVRLVRRGSLHYRRGSNCWEMGFLQEAQRNFQTAARWSFGGRRTEALARVGLCQLHRGEYAQAVATLEPLMGRALPRSSRVLWAALPGQLALCLTLQGDTSRARRWLEEAHRRCEGTATFLILPEAALLCREGRFGAALQRLDDWWPLLRFEGYLCDRTRLLREFASWRLEPERYARESVVQWLVLPPFRQEELDFFDAHWPLLADFMWTAQVLRKRFGRLRGFKSATRMTPA